MLFNLTVYVLTGVKIFHSICVGLHSHLSDSGMLFHIYSGVARQHVVTCQGLLVRTLYYSFDGQLQIVLLPLSFGGNNTMFS